LTCALQVELEIEVPTAELAGIEQQMERLNELEGLQDDWRVQAEARDEVGAAHVSAHCCISLLSCALKS
jgi:hypothetical protein